jgi:hypothetical protein
MQRGNSVKLVIAGAVLATLAAPLAAQAQGIPGGVAHGVYQGNQIAGPIGAVVGGAVGGVIGGIEGVLGINHQYSGPYAEPPHPRVTRHRKTARHASRVRRVQ